MPFKTTVQEATPETVLEVDEIFSYILLKINQIRIWIAENKQTKQIVSFFIGDGSMEFVSAYGENYRTVIYVVRASQIFGNRIIVYPKQLIPR